MNVAIWAGRGEGGASDGEWGMIAKLFPEEDAGNLSQNGVFAGHISVAAFVDLLSAFFLFLFLFSFGNLR